MHEDADDHLVNVLGAQVLAVGDLLDEAVVEASGTSRSGAAAMAVLVQAGPLPVTELGRRVGLSQPAAARMVDALSAAGLARREPGEGRAVPVVLTARGRRTARKVLAARAERLGGLLEGLSGPEQRTLARLLGTVLADVYEAMPDARLICRLCDRSGCVRTAERCPVGAAAGEPPGG